MADAPRATMALRRASVVVFPLLAATACAPPPGLSSDRGTPDDGTESALTERAPAPPLLGTYDIGAESHGSEIERFVFVADRRVVVCPSTGSSDRRCAHAATTTTSRFGAGELPYELTTDGAGAQRLVIHEGPVASPRADPPPAGLSYAVTRSDSDVVLTLHPLGASGADVVLRRRSCSETMYADTDAEHACAFYQCKLDAAPTPSGRCSYFSDFGLPYCKKFFAVDFEDRVFGASVRQCLQEAIRDRLEGRSCDVVKDTAFRSHVECYVQGGYCELTLADKLKVMKTIELRDWTLGNGMTLANIESACSERR